jgi:hypothetical protein
MRAIVVLTLLISASARAQDSAAAPLSRAAYAALVRVEQEPTYASFPGLLFGLPRDPHNGQTLRILYEASISPPLFVYGGRKPVLVAITPKVIVRQYAGGSYPVPPPSYMPRITAYYWGRPFSQRTHVDSATYAFLRLGHHSNGQEGLFYDTTAAPGTINYRDGDFFTNYLEFGLVRRFARSTHAGARQLTFQWHPQGWMGKPTRSLYGRYRTQFTSRFVLSESFRIVDGADISVGYIGGSMLPGRRDVRSRTTVAASLYSDLAEFGDFQPFVRYYTGQDYYNLRFSRNISTFMIGAVVGSARPR